MLNKLVKIANKLDKMGWYNEANYIDYLIKRVARGDHGLADALRSDNRGAVMMALESMNSSLPEQSSIMDELGMSPVDFGNFMGAVYRGDLDSARKLYGVEIPSPAEYSSTTMTSPMSFSYEYGPVETSPEVGLEPLSLEPALEPTPGPEPKPKGPRKKKVVHMPRKSPPKPKSDESKKEDKPEEPKELELKKYTRRSDATENQYIVFPKGWKGINKRERWHLVPDSFTQKDLENMPEEELISILKKIEEKKAKRREFIKRKKQMG